MSVIPFVSQPLWLALPTVRIPRNRLTPASSSQANAASSPRPPSPFSFSFPLSFLLYSLSYILLLLLFPSPPEPGLSLPRIPFLLPFSSRLPWNSRPSCSCPCPCPCSCPCPCPCPPLRLILLLSGLRNVLFTPVCLLPAISGSETSISLPFASFLSFLAQNRLFHSRFSLSRHFWLRIALFTPGLSIVGRRTLSCDLLKRVLFTFCG